MSASEMARAVPSATPALSAKRGEPTISAWPKLRLQMLRARPASALAFPFDRSPLSYFYLARNGIVALAQQWGLCGREVLMPAYCHGIEVRSLLHAGALPRFYPVHGSMKVFPEEVMARVTPATRAIYLIHYVGFPGPVEELAALCQSRGILLIEDCALALFSKLGERPLGSFGDASIFCLYKTLPLPNGGAVLLKNAGRLVPTAQLSPTFASTLAYTALAAFRPLPQAADDAGVGDQPRTLQRIARRVLSPFGLARVGSERFEPRDLGLGMSHLCHRVIAASDATDIAARRRRNYLELAEGLAGIANIVHPELRDGICPLFFAIQTQHKKVLRERLLARGIETVDLWRFDAPGVRPREFPEVDDLRRTVLEIPCHQDLAPEEMGRIASAILRERSYC